MRRSAEPYALSIADAARLLRERKLSPVELVASVSERIETVEKHLHSYATMLLERARGCAAIAEQEMAQGHFRGPLHGIPVSLKDVYCTAGIPTEAGSSLLEGHVPERDSAVALSLKKSGAILIGKTTTPEFAYYAFRKGPHRTRNPWNLEYHPGDSSTGAAVSVAACCAMGGMGTDTGGSIRKPASMTGVVGFKPTFGRVSKQGVIPLSATLDHCGPITRTVEDTALMMLCIAGYDPDDATTIDLPVPDFTAGINGGVKGLRLGVDRQHFFSARVTPTVRSAVESALDTFRSLGAVVIDIHIPEIETAIAAGGIIVMVEAAAYHRKWLIQQPHRYEPLNRFMLQLGERILGADYLRACQIRGRFKETMRDLFGESRLSALLAPTLPTTAIPLSEQLHLEDAPFTPTLEWNQHCMPFNVTGQPALTVPCGFSSDRLPVGLQIVGRPFEEQTVLRIGKAFEDATNWHDESPPT